jgi:hypothetical protein
MNTIQIIYLYMREANCENNFIQYFLTRNYLEITHCSWMNTNKKASNEGDNIRLHLFTALL